MIAITTGPNVTGGPSEFESPLGHRSQRCAARDTQPTSRIRKSELRYVIRTDGVMQPLGRLRLSAVGGIKSYHPYLLRSRSTQERAMLTEPSLPLLCRGCRTPARHSRRRRIVPARPTNDVSI